MASNTKNLTITLGLEEYGDLEYLVNYFQEQSISTVTKTDVIKFMIKQMKRTVEQDLVNDYNKMLNNAEKDNSDNE
jgi:uncharacterized protein YlbG (UPF0298 family)